MNKYRVYYSDEGDTRELSRMKFIMARGTNRIEAYQDAIRNCPFAWQVKWGIVEKRDSDQLHILPETMSATTSQSEDTPDTVQVSWWRKGAREGLYSQQAYPVISREGEWVTISLMGKPKVVKATRTRSVA